MRDFTNSNNEVQPQTTLPDREIQTLSVVLDPIRLRKNLRFLSLSPWQWGKLGDIRIQVLRCHKGRCTFEVALCTATGMHTLIGKVYAEDASDIFQAMERIRQAGFGPEQEYSIPEPVAYLAELRLLMQEKVEGRLAKDVFLEGDEEDRAIAADQCARWLARFHAAAPKAGPVLDLNDYMAFLEQCSRNVASSDPLSGKVAQLFQCLKRAASALDHVESRACHGDYGPIQVILADGRTVTCDWDRYGVADPHRDLARFLVQLERFGLKRFGSIRALDRSAQVFLKTYAGLGEPANELHLRFFKGANHLKWTTEKIAKPHWREKIEATLDASLRLLATVVLCLLPCFCE
jgi:aminoglycoside phosphotransferase (APT) family kinase protein